MEVPEKGNTMEVELSWLSLLLDVIVGFWYTPVGLKSKSRFCSHLLLRDELESIGWYHREVGVACILLMNN